MRTCHRSRINRPHEGNAFATRANTVHRQNSQGLARCPRLRLVGSRFCGDEVVRVHGLITLAQCIFYRIKVKFKLDTIPQKSPRDRLGGKIKSQSRTVLEWRGYQGASSALAFLLSRRTDCRDRRWPLPARVPTVGLRRVPASDAGDDSPTCPDCALTTSTTHTSKCTCSFRLEPKRWMKVTAPIRSAALFACAALLACSVCAMTRKKIGSAWHKLPRSGG